MSNTNAFAGLEPRGFWTHFEAITKIPRPSGQEEKMVEYIRSWATARGYQALQDAVGNLCVRVPGRAPFETAPPIVLQSHLDMVCERNSGCPYDAAAGNIHVIRDGDWLYAEGTTLGADNGIGCAAMLYAAEMEDGGRAPLELLFTIDEERGLTGVKNLDPSLIRGRTLLNLDSEDDTLLVVGCAGGCGTTIRWSERREPAPPGWIQTEVHVSGLQGGHSGLEIDKARLNAIRALGRMLQNAAREVPLRLINLHGGEKTNAIPRECRAVVAYPAASDQAFRGQIEQTRLDFVAQYRGQDEGLAVRFEQAPTPAPPYSQEGTARLLDLLCSIPTGVIALSPDIPGLVETSNNLGVVRTAGDEVEIRCSSRSSNSQALNEVLNWLHALARMAGATAQKGEGYPGWKPDMSSRALKVTRETYRRLFDAEPGVTAIHAGLECGLIGTRIPGMDMVSLGPELRGVHAPGERVRISSVERFTKLLAAVLTDLSS